MTLREIFEGLPEDENVLLHKAPTRYALHDRHDRIVLKLWSETVIASRQGGLTEVWPVNNSPVGTLELSAEYAGLDRKHVDALKRVFPAAEKVKDLVTLMHSGWRGWRVGQGMELGWETRRAVLDALFELGVVGETEKYGMWQDMSC